MIPSLTMPRPALLLSLVAAVLALEPEATIEVYFGEVIFEQGKRNGIGLRYINCLKWEGLFDLKLLVKLL